MSGPARNSNGRLTRDFYLRSTSVILLVTGLFKILGAVGPVPLLLRPDPLFEFVSNGQVLFGSGVLEVAVAITLWSQVSPVAKLWLASWLALLIGVYRLGLWWTGFSGYCSCLGNIGEMFDLNPGTVEMVSKLILGYLFCSFAFLLIHYFGRCTSFWAAGGISADSSS
jgi:hypothetical protein